MSTKIKGSLPQKSILATALLLALGSAHAETIPVTTSSGTGPGSLSAAIAQSNGNSQDDKIVFDSSLSGSTISLAGSSPLSIDDSPGDHSLEIEGLGRDVLTITGSNGSRIFFISGIDTVTISDLTIDVNTNPTAPSHYGGDIIRATHSSALTLSNVTLNNTQAVEDLKVRGISASAMGKVEVNNSTISNMETDNRGAAISFNAYNTDAPELTISNSTISGNSAANDGGAIHTYAYNGADLDLNISNTTFDSNTTASGGKGGSDGGALHISAYNANVDASIINSTFSGNTANGQGGALDVETYPYSRIDVAIANSTLSGNDAANGGAISLDNTDGYYSYIEANIVNSTITANTADTEAGGIVATEPGEYSDTGLAIKNSVIAGNTVAAAASNIQLDTSISMRVVKNNYFGTGNTNFTVPANNLSGDSPDLGALADNGGLTQTHMPNENSPLIDAGDSSLAEINGVTFTIDQRSFERVAGSSVDIGAVEVGGSLVVPGSGGGSGGGGGGAMTWLAGLMILLRRRR